MYEVQVMALETQSQRRYYAPIMPAGGALSFQMKMNPNSMKWTVIPSSSSPCFSPYRLFIPKQWHLCLVVLHWTKIKYNFKHIRLHLQIHYEKMLSHTKNRLNKVLLLVLYKRESQRFYHIIMYRCHLLYCSWPMRRQVSADHTCLYKQMSAIRTANTARDNKPVR